MAVISKRRQSGRGTFTRGIQSFGWISGVRGRRSAHFVTSLNPSPKVRKWRPRDGTCRIAHEDKRTPLPIGAL